MNLKQFRRRFGIAAPKVAVRTHVKWYWYAAIVAGGALLVAAIVWSLAQYGETAMLRKELESAAQEAKTLQEENLKLRAAAGTEQSAVQMERSAQQQLVARLKVLEAENAGLKEEIALFERLVPPADGNESLVRVERLRVTPEPEAGRYRYRLLLGFQASKQSRDFKGNIQIYITTREAGQEKQIRLPAGTGDNPDYQIELRHFLRKEGVFEIPPGAHLQQVEVRVFQGGTLKAKGQAQL